MEKAVDFENVGLKNLVTILLLGLSLFVALMLETRMTDGVVIEMIIILAGVVLMGAIILGMWVEAEWAYPLASIFFAASLANLAWLFYNTGAFLPFAFGLIVNIAGLVMCLVTTQESDDLVPLETYDLDEIKHELNQLREEREARTNKKATTTKKKSRKTSKKKRK